MKKRPKYSRKKNVLPIQLRERDRQIFDDIYDHGGLLTFRHIQARYWNGNHPRTAERRIEKLFHSGFIEWPQLGDRQTKPIPERFYWLGWRGILDVAKRRGIAVPEPKSEDPHRINITQMRQLKRNLAKQGCYWLDRPLWGQIAHDLGLVDFQIKAESDLQSIPFLSLDHWILENEFRANPDQVTYKGAKNGKPKGVIPDRALVIVHEGLRKKGVAEHIARFQIEYDMANHDNPAFRNDKAAPYAAYITSPSYRQRFGNNAGFWLIVTTGKRRMENLMKGTKDVVPGDTHLFYFSTIPDVMTKNIFRDPIWWQVGEDEPRPLIPAE